MVEHDDKSNEPVTTFRDTARRVLREFGSVNINISRLKLIADEMEQPGREDEDVSTETIRIVQETAAQFIATRETLRNIGSNPEFLQEWIQINNKPPENLLLELEESLNVELNRLNWGTVEVFESGAALVGFEENEMSTHGIRSERADIPNEDERRSGERQEFDDIPPEDVRRALHELSDNLDEIENMIPDINVESMQEYALNGLEAVRDRVDTFVIGIEFFIEKERLKPKGEKNIEEWLLLLALAKKQEARGKSLYRRIKDKKVEPDEVIVTPPPPPDEPPGPPVLFAFPGGDENDGDDERHVGHDYPHMGDYDMAKRYLLAPEVDLFEYEEVRDWGVAEIIQALVLFIKMYLSRDYHFDRPFGTQELMKMHVSIKPPEEDQRTMDMAEAINELGVEQTQVVLDRFKATQETTRQADAHQSERILGGNAPKIIELTTLTNSLIEGLFDVEARDKEGNLVELRPRGLPVTNSVLLRFVLTSMYNRGYNEDLGEKKKKPTPFAQETGERTKYKRAAGQIVDGVVGILQYIKRKHENAPGFVEDPDMEWFLDAMTYNEDWAHEGEEFADDDTIKRIATSVVMEAMNLGDVFLFRALHDLGGSRHDELDISRLLRFRASQQKYFNYDDDGVFSYIEGSLEVKDKGIIAFWESLYHPRYKRIRTRPIYLYKEKVENKDQIRVGSAERQLPDAFRDWEIPNISPLEDEQRKEVIRIHGSIEKARDDLFDEEAKEAPVQVTIDNLNATIDRLHGELFQIVRDAGIMDDIEEGDEDQAYRGGMIITSLEHLIVEAWPKDINDETKIINHVTPVRDALRDWDVDMDNLVVRVSREGGGGEFVTFNPTYGAKLSELLRSAFYYWIQDYRVKSLSPRGYQEMCENYAEPRRESFPEGQVGDNAYDHEMEIWQREWAWRGIPLRIYKRVSEDDNKIELDENGEPVIDYVEYSINQLFNFHLDLDKIVNQGRLSEEEAKWHVQDFKRVVGAEDQLSALMKVCAEKIVMIQIKNHLDAGKKWTGEHTEALVKMMSSPAFYADMEGVRGLLLRHKTGLWGFSTGPGDTYKGAGGWSRDEAINMIKSAVGSLRTFAAPPKKD